MGQKERGGGLRTGPTTSLRGGEAAAEQDAVGLAVLDEEKEGVVGAEPGRDSRTPQHHDGRGGGRGLRAFLVDLHEGLVHHLGQIQVFPGRHPRKVCPGLLEGIGHAQGAEDILHVVVLLQLKSREEHFGLFFVQHVRPRPLCEFLVSEFSLHLEES